MELIQMRHRPGAPKRSGRLQPDKKQLDTLLNFFFPIHYKLGNALEEVLSRGKLTRKQTAILWLIRAEGGINHSVPRKRVERLLVSWYEVTSSAITKAIRAMSRPPLQLVEIFEDPNSGREKRIALTKTGEEFVEAMAVEGRRFVTDLVRAIDQPTIHDGIQFLSEVTQRLDELRVARLEDARSRSTRRRHAKR